MGSFLYFAYGSNLLTARLRERTPSAVPLGPARLPGHALRWHKVGGDGSGKCDVVEVGDPRSCVHGVVFRIAMADKPALDRAESLGVGYAEKSAEVLAAAGRWRAGLYVALRTDPALRPFDWYHALVLAGAREHALDAAYVAALRAVATCPDPDAARARRHFDLADPGSAAGIGRVAPR